VIMAAKACEDIGVEHLRPVTNKIELGRRTQYANALLHGGWPYVEGGVGPLPCPASIPDCNGFGIPTDWKRKGAVCRDVVIAFRGTDFDSLDDWLANHASCRSRTSTSGRAQIKNIVAKIERYPCYQPGTTIIATGHSLGGGLTQHAAYANSKIRYVYAFDPSLVTGFVDLSETLREKNTKNLPIGHVYEHGEILAYVRYGAEERVPAAAVRPAGAARALQRARLTEKLLDWKAAPPHVVASLPVATPEDRAVAGCDAMAVRTTLSATSLSIVRRGVVCDSRAETR
jgi:hypothetical protein